MNAIRSPRCRKSAGFEPHERPCACLRSGLCLKSLIGGHDLLAAFRRAALRSGFAGWGCCFGGKPMLLRCLLLGPQPPFLVVRRSFRWRFLARRWTRGSERPVRRSRRFGHRPMKFGCGRRRFLARGEKPACGFGRRCGSGLIRLSNRCSFPPTRPLAWRRFWSGAGRDRRCSLRW